jgi:hypothetical protein
MPLELPRIPGQTTVAVPARPQSEYPDWWLSGLFVRILDDGTSNATLRFHRYNYTTKEHMPEPRVERTVELADLWALAEENESLATAMGAIVAAVAGMAERIEPTVEEPLVEP